MKNSLDLIAKINIVPEFLNSILDELDKLSILSQQEKGNIQYLLIKEYSENNIIFIFEKWESKEAFETHKNTSHFINYKLNTKHMIQSDEIFIKEI